MVTLEKEDLLDGINNTVLYLPVLLATTAGLRRGEICGLRWEDVNFETWDIYIRNNLNWGNGRLTLKPVKTSNSERSVRLSAMVIDALKKQKKEQAKNKLMAGLLYQGQGFVWSW